MTAEIAILNRMAVALAADSKVTIGSGGREKTYDTVNKLFTLSLVHPVGVMIYGNADFMGFPWETIIKCYRRDKKDKSEKTVSAWAADFIQHVGSYYPFVKVDFDNNIRDLSFAVWQDIQERALREVNVAPKKFDEALQEELDYEIFRAKNSAEFLVGAAHADFITKFGGLIDDFVANVGADEAIRTKLKELLLLSIARHRYSPISSGIVVAGFGDTQRLPAIESHQLDGFVGSTLKVSQSMTYEIDREMGRRALVVPFAQKDMVARFMEGIDPSYKSFLEGSIRALVVDSATSILENYCDSKIDLKAAKIEVEKIATEQFNKFSDSAGSWRRQQFVSPITEMVTTLPKEELASMAEALVNLTSLKRRISHDRETVGGPVDVAVISKGDGFVWIKRKHYFEQELNHHFRANYFRVLEEESENGKDAKGS